MNGLNLSGRPVPTPLALGLWGLALIPAVLSFASPAFGWVAGAFDLAVALLVALDGLCAPTAESLELQREVAPVLSAGVRQPVWVALRNRGTRPLRGELRDTFSAFATAEGHRRSFTLAPGASERAAYALTSSLRGDLAFGDFHVRLLGPLGLCARQQRVGRPERVKVYPDLSILSQDALSLAREADAASRRRVRKRSEGREFESLREYREGDPYRSIDWKATARRGRHMVRLYEPERNQCVLLLLDCGRHMAGEVDGRRKLDLAVDAALRLAKVSLDKGDQVGVVAFATEVLALLPPRKGAEHLRAITEALYRAEAQLSESDYGKAIDRALAHHHPRSLIITLTDLSDPDASAVLVRRTLSLRPRHLPLVVSLLDEALQRAAADEPLTAPQAYLRQAATRLEDDYRLTAARLRSAGALALRVRPADLGAAAVNAYLQVKSSGLL